MTAIIEENLILTKLQLQNSIGDQFPIYLQYMKCWFRKTWTQDIFDTECRKLLQPEQMPLHNRFFRALLNKIYYAADLKIKSESKDVSEPQRSSTKVKVKSKSTQFIKKIKHVKSNNGLLKKCMRSRQPLTFDSPNLMSYLTENIEIICPSSSVPPPVSGFNSSIITGTGSANDQSDTIPLQRFSAQELFLPDPSLITGRLLVGAWELGLNSVDETIAEYMVIAVQLLLKNILTEIILNKKHHRTSNGQYFYDIGIELKNPIIRNTIVRDKIDDNENPMPVVNKELKILLKPKPKPELEFLGNCEQLDLTSKINRRINILDLFTALHNKNIIPSHHVYSVNIERISQMLH